MLRVLALYVLTVLAAGCSPGDDAVSRNEGPLGADDLPAEYSEQVTTISVRGDEGAWHWKQDAGWTEISRIRITYDKRGRPIEERASSRDAEGWIDARLVQISYGHPEGSVTRVISVPRYDDEGLPDNTGSDTGSGTGSDADKRTMWRNDRMEQRFKHAGRVDSVRTYSWVDGRWLDGHRTTYSYGRDGTTDETVTYHRGTHAWVPFIRTTHTETADGEHETLIHHRRDSEWVVTRREVTRESK